MKIIYFRQLTIRFYNFRNLIKKKIKLAIIGSRGYPYVYSGYETFVKELVERLINYQVEIYVYCQKDLFEERPTQLNGINLIYISTLPQKAFNQLVHSFLSMIHVTFSKTDVVLVVNLAAGPIGWLPKLTGKKMIINTDGLEWERPKWKGLGATYFRFGAWCATKFYDLLVSDAEAMKDVYLKKFNCESTVIAYGAPVYKEQSNLILDKYKLEPKSYYLIVGRLIPDNNANLLVEEFLRSNSSKKLVVVGDAIHDGYFTKRLKALSSDKLIFTGYIKDQNELLGLYQHCFAYLHGHEYGGTNPTMLKAMANRCAILALDTVFNREMLHEGEFGLFFDKSQNSLINKMKEIEAQPQIVNYLSEIVSKGLTDKYNWDNVVQQYLNIIKKVLN